jgi:hypothetical protein
VVKGATPLFTVLGGEYLFRFMNNLPTPNRDVAVRAMRSDKSFANMGTFDVFLTAMP